jgi:hypothetical protein
VADAIGPALRAALAATDWREREQHLAAAYEALAVAQNDIGLAAAVDPRTRPYFGRPFRVLMADRFAGALLGAVTDPAVSALPRVGAIDQHVDSTDLLTDTARARVVAIAALRGAPAFATQVQLPPAGP